MRGASDRVTIFNPKTKAMSPRNNDSIEIIEQALAFLLTISSLCRGLQGRTWEALGAAFLWNLQIPNITTAITNRMDNKINDRINIDATLAHIPISGRIDGAHPIPISGVRLRKDLSLQMLAHQLGHLQHGGFSLCFGVARRIPLRRSVVKRYLALSLNPILRGDLCSLVGAVDS